MPVVSEQQEITPESTEPIVIDAETPTATATTEEEISTPKTEDSSKLTDDSMDKSDVKSEPAGNSTETTEPVDADTAKVKADVSVEGTLTGEGSKGAGENPEKSGDEKVEVQKPEGESEQLEVLVDDTQNDLDADLLNSQSSSKTEGASEAGAMATGDGKDAGPLTDTKTEGDDSAKGDAFKTGEGETKTDDKKPDEKRLVWFV